MTANADPRHRAYTPHGAALELFRSRDPEVLLAGPAGTGKSRAALEKLFFLAHRYPGCRLLICRKTRASLTESALVTWERDVVPERHPCLTPVQRRLRQAYTFPNGSIVALGGLDQPSRVMSTEWDCIYIQEATDGVTEEDWESLSSRLRNGVVPYQQLLADANPSAPSHWLKMRCDRGQTRMIHSRHEDNPLLFRAGEWTEAGKTYLARLDQLTGPRYHRLRHGRWVGAEGQVYEEWNPEVHLVNRRPVPHSWPRLWAIDFGFVCPAVFQHWALDGDGRMFLVQEIYQTNLLVEDLAKLIKRVTKGQPDPTAIVCDHDSEDRATLFKHLGRPTVAAKKAVGPGIQAVKSRLRTAGDGKPRLMLFRDALVQRDPALVEAKRPTCTAEEVEGYCWDSRSGTGKEQPIKNDDHGLDSLRYAVAHLDGLGRKRLVFY